MLPPSGVDKVVSMGTTDAVKWVTFTELTLEIFVTCVYFMNHNLYLTFYETITLNLCLHTSSFAACVAMVTKS